MALLSFFVLLADAKRTLRGAGKRLGALGGAKVDEKGNAICLFFFPWPNSMPFFSFHISLSFSFPPAMLPLNTSASPARASAAQAAAASGRRKAATRRTSVIGGAALAGAALILLLHRRESGSGSRPLLDRAGGGGEPVSSASSSSFSHAPPAKQGAGLVLW
jgi:hypothetical protein